MKTRLNPILVIAAALSVSAFATLSAASTQNLPVAFPVKTLTATDQGGEQIERGASRGFVSWAMRSKHREELAPDVWAYSGYHANLDLANQQGCGTLIITFVHDKVVSMQLVNKPAAGLIAANLKASPALPTQSIASK